MRYTIPEIRDRLRELASNLEPLSRPVSDELRELADALHRRKPVRKAESRLKLTDEKRQEIRQYAEGFPDASYHEIALAVGGVNVGMVSRAIVGELRT